jgi:hypothetical protein
LWPCEKRGGYDDCESFHEEPGGIGELEAIEQQQDPIFASPRDVFLELVLSIHEAAGAKMRKAWWPPP